MQRADRSRPRCSLQVEALSALSPFVLPAHDSESRDADPSGTSLAIPNRLAGDQPDRSLSARGRSLRALPASPWSPCGSACGRRWCLVGRGGPIVARWPRSPASPPPSLHRPRCDPNDAQTGLSRNRSFEPRPQLQRATLEQSSRTLSALPHDPRCRRASSTSLVECVSTTRPRRSVHWALFLSLRYATSAATS